MCSTRYAVDGVMIGRAALGRPWMFRQIDAALQGEPIPPDPPAADQRACLLGHYDLIVERFGAEKGTMLMRKYACCYAQGRHGCASIPRPSGDGPISGRVSPSGRRVLSDRMNDRRAHSEPISTPRGRGVVHR